jgi:hypothetical protein
LPELVPVDLILLLEPQPTLLLLQGTIDLVHLPLGWTRSRQARLGLDRQDHDRQSEAKQNGRHHHGAHRASLSELMITIWNGKPNGSTKFRMRQDRRHSGLDAVRLLIHGRADESA